jgi:biopolymer transport protein ExbB
MSPYQEHQTFRLNRRCLLVISLAVFSYLLARSYEPTDTVAAAVPAVALGDPIFLAEAAPLLPLPEPEGPAEPTAETGSGRTLQRPNKPLDTRGQSAPGQESSSPSAGGVLPDEGRDKPKDKSSSLSFWGIVKAGGTVGILIMLLSIVAVALAVEHLLSLRQDLFMPPAVIEGVSAKLSARDWNGILDVCRANPSVLSQVLASGVAEHEAGWNEMEKVMEEALAEQTARWNRKVEYLSVIGNIAPMLGLLGTVIGMILAFRTVAETQGAARAADLAESIYLALVTTVEGLIVAIPSLAAYAFFRNRVDELMAEVAGTVQKMFAPLKRRRPAGVKPAAVPPSPGASH